MKVKRQKQQNDLYPQTVVKGHQKYVKYNDKNIKHNFGGKNVGWLESIGISSCKITNFIYIYSMSIYEYTIYIQYIVFIYIYKYSI